MPDQRKRKKYCDRGDKKKGKWADGAALEPGLTGYMFTCDGHEKQAVAEAYDLLDRIAEQVDAATSQVTAPEDVQPGPNPKTDNQATDSSSACKHERNESEGEASGEEDIAEVLKRECVQASDNGKNSANGQRNTNRRRQKRTGVKNILFIPCKDKMEDANRVAERMVRDVLETGQSVGRYLQRVSPVQTTCKAFPQDFLDTAKLLLPRHFEKIEPPPSYAVIFKARNNDQIARNFVYDTVGDIVKSCSPFAKVDLNNPDKAILVDVIHKIMCISVVENFTSLKKYTLRAPPNGATTTAQVKDKGDDKND